MKKISFILALAFAFTTLPAFASTITLSPTTAFVTSGQSVSFTVTANADSGSTLSTVKTNIAYPTALLTPTSFAFAPNWMPLTQTGYDQMTNGLVIKTGGYPGGFTGSKVIGTLVFRATATGVATITVQNTSLMYTTSNQNTLAGQQASAQITITAVPITTTTTNTTNTGTTTIKTPTTTTTQPVATPTDGTTVTSPTPVTPVNALAANAAGAGSTAIPAWGWILIILAVIALIFGGRYFYKKNKTAAPTTTK